MPKRNRFQTGSLELVNTRLGLCWYLRYTQHNADGTTSRPRARVGLKSEFPTRAAAGRSRIAGEIREQIQAGPAPLVRTFGDVIARYKGEEIPEHHSTKVSYASILDNHIAPRWSRYAIEDVRPGAVRDWLRSLKLADGTKGNIKAQMSVLFRCAMLWDWMPHGENPMSLFRIEGSSKRQKEPRTLSLEEYGRVLKAVPDNPWRTMVIADMCLGLRCSELLALKWSDFDFFENTLHIQRARVMGVVGKVKTKYSEKKLPLDPRLAAVFLAWRAETEFDEESDWVFASPSHPKFLPYRANNVQRRILLPAGKAAGLDFPLGFHTFRHTYKSWMDEKGVSLTVQRDLMRHADLRTTAMVYGDVHMKTLRPANAAVVDDAIKGEK